MCLVCSLLAKRLLPRDYRNQSVLRQNKSPIAGIHAEPPTMPIKFLMNWMSLELANIGEAENEAGREKGYPAQKCAEEILMVNQAANSVTNSIHWIAFIRVVDFSKPENLGQ